jgi:hypothetical protein
MLLTQAITNLGAIFVLFTLILSGYHILESDGNIAEIKEKELIRIPIDTKVATEITEANIQSTEKKENTNTRKKRRNRSIQYEWNVLNTG